jgi:hypothetical protein
LIRGEVGGLAGEGEENGLSDVFGELGGADLAAGGGIDESEVARDKCGEGGVGAFAGVALEELMIAHGGWLHGSRRGGGNPTGIF